MAPTVDAFTVREERGEEEKGGAPWGLAVVMSPLTPIGTRVALAGIDTVAMPRTIACSEEDDDADQRGPGISGKERGRRGSGRG
jgi:hypothetical protein